VSARSETWVYGRSLAGIAASNPAGDMVVCCECCVLSGCVSELITRPEKSTEHNVSECNLETSTMRRPRPTVATEP
jgi:hypothetical protein